MNACKSVAKSGYTWNKKSAGAALSKALETLAVRYPALDSKAKGATEIVFKKSDDECVCSVADEDGKIVISYGRLNMALRMVGAVLSGVMPAKAEHCPFKMLGIMLDCSRDAVMKIDHLKGYLDHLAILGYNMVMLYTEDTYQIETEPMFGFMRGGYTKADIREIDKYAAKLGIEIIPCIQALAHLEQIFRWENYAEINDCNGILLAEDPKTYELIDKMLSFWEDAVKSRRIHLGMDEAHGLGTGKYAKLHGKKSAFEVINTHLQKVCELCKKHGFSPMIWSDMYFRIGSKNNDYYDLESQPPEDVVKGIPEGLQLVYWDYYHDNKDLYSKMIEKHCKIAGKPIMASGVWTWNKFWYDHVYTRSTVVPCLEACREAQLDEVVFTMWGDAGAFCDYDSAMAGLAYSAELAFTGKADDAVLEKRLDKLFNGSSYKAICALGEVMAYPLPPVIFDDPLMLFLTKSYKTLKEEVKVYDGVYNYSTMAKAYKHALDILEKTPAKGEAGNIKLARALASAVVAKLAWAEAVFAMSGKKNMRASIEKALPLAKAYQKAFKTFYKEFCAMWHANNRPFGLESIQIRLGGQMLRSDEAVKRLEEFLASDDKVFPEFAELARAGDALQTGVWKSFAQSACATTIF